MAGTRAARASTSPPCAAQREQRQPGRARAAARPGYRPPHRVFTVPGRLNRVDLVGMAILLAGSTPVDGTASCQARFELAERALGHQVGCYAIVGADALQLQSPMRVVHCSRTTGSPRSLRLSVGWPHAPGDGRIQ